MAERRYTRNHLIGFTLVGLIFGILLSTFPMWLAPFDSLPKEVQWEVLRPSDDGYNTALQNIGSYNRLMSGYRSTERPGQRIEGADNSKYFYFERGRFWDMWTRLDCDGYVFQMGHQDNTPLGPSTNDKFFGYFQPANYDEGDNQITVIPDVIIHYNTDDSGCPERCVSPAQH
jgi:hypothetical protein